MFNPSKPPRVGARRRPVVQRLAWWMAAAGMGSVIYGCAEALEGPDATNAAAVARGKAFAERACGSCHGLGATEASNFSGAPPFRDMRYDYNAISFERRLAQMHSGFITMPPELISLKDIADIGAYVHSLKQTGKRRRR